MKGKLGLYQKEVRSLSKRGKVFMKKRKGLYEKKAKANWNSFNHIYYQFFLILPVIKIMSLYPKYNLKHNRLELYCKVVL